MKLLRHAAFASILGFTASLTLHAQFFGAPSPSGQVHAHVFSFGYTRVAEDFDAHHCDIGGSVTGAGSFSSGAACSGGRRITSNRLWLADGYAFNDRWELNGELGGQDIKIDDIFAVLVNGQNTVNPTFSRSFRPYGGIGVRGLFASGAHHGFGMVMSTHYFGKFDKTIGGSFLEPVFGSTTTYSLDFTTSAHWDLNYALAYQYRWGGGGAWYIGPYGYWSDSSWDYSATVTNTAFPGVVGFASSSTKMRPKHPYGAMTGVRLPFAGKWRFLAEAQYRNGFTGTVGLGYAF